MTTKRFRNYGELTSDLAFDLIEIVNSLDAESLGLTEINAVYGASNVSCSSYVTVDFISDDEECETLKLRFSDHADYHGSDITLRIDDKINVVEDDGEYVATEISTEDFAAILATAKAQIESFARQVSQ